MNHPATDVKAHHLTPQAGRASVLSSFRNSAGPLAREATYITTFRPAEMPVHPSGLRTSVFGNHTSSPRLRPGLQNATEWSFRSFHGSAGTARMGYDSAVSADSFGAGTVDGRSSERPLL